MNTELGSEVFVKHNQSGMPAQSSFQLHEGAEEVAPAGRTLCGTEHNNRVLTPTTQKTVAQSVQRGSR
jgi:hypothetical protein